MENREKIIKEDYPEVDPREYVRMISRRWKLIVAVTVAVMLITITFTQASPKKYKVETVLQVASVIDKDNQFKPVEDITKIKEKNENDIYGAAVRLKMGISQKDYPSIRFFGQGDSSLISMSIAHSNPDTAKEILRQTALAIAQDQQAEVENSKQKLLKIIEIEKKDTARIEEMLASAEKIKKILDEEIILLNRSSSLNLDLGRQWAMLQANEQKENIILEMGKYRSELISQEILLNDLDDKLKKAESTKIVKEPAVVGESTGIRFSVAAVFGLSSGFLFGLFLAIFNNWWKNHE